MELSQVAKELKDASNLLEMIDCLTNGVATGNLADSHIPWSGIQMTISQVKDIVERSADALNADASVQNRPAQVIQPVQEPAFHRPEPTPVRSETLVSRVDRVKQVTSTPTSSQSRARELLNNVTSSVVNKD